MDQQAMHEGLMELLESTSSLIEMVAGYRENCVKNGFSETAAEKMAVAMHGLMLTKIAEA
jgi:hypothetical protein